MTDCNIEIWEQPARKVKFRMEVHGHRCQSKELLVGRNSTDEGRIFPLVKVTCGGGVRIRDSIRRDLHVRMSLVDIRSNASHVVEHYHKLVDCNTRGQEKNRSIVKRLQPNDDRVIFDNLGIVKTLEKDKEEEVTERMTSRRQEAGDILNAWVKQDIKDKATSQAKETSPYRLKLMFEAFLYDESGVVVKVAPDMFSEEIVDLTNTTTGDLAVRKMNRAADTVVGRQEIMMFTGGGKPECKVSHARAIFQAEFFELDPKDPNEERKVWSTVVDIRENELHTVGQFLGGVHFLVPPYKDQDIVVPTQNVYCQLIKRNKAKVDQIQAKSDPLSFTYTPLVRTLQMKSLKRPMEKQILKTFVERNEGPPQVVPFESKWPKFEDLVMPPQPINPSLRQTVAVLSQRNATTPGSPFSPSHQFGRMTIEPPDPTQNATANIMGSPNSTQSNRPVSIVSPNPPKSNIPIINLVPSNPPTNTLSPNQSFGFVSTNSTNGFPQHTLIFSSPATSPVYPPTPSPMYMPQPGTSPTPSSMFMPQPGTSPTPSSMFITQLGTSPSASMNDSTSPFMSMKHASSSNTLMIDPHGLANVQSSAGTSPQMGGLWPAESQNQQNQIKLNLGPDLGEINFGDLLKDSTNHHGGGGIQSDSEKFEDIFVHEIIATDSVSKLNSSDTNEMKEKQIGNQSNKKSKNKIDNSKSFYKDEKLETQTEQNSIVEKTRDQHQNDLSECIATLSLN